MNKIETKYSRGKYKSILVLTLFCLFGCRAYVLDNAQDDLRSSFERGNFEQSKSLLNKFGSKDVYKSKDQVLYNLEFGTVLHFSGDYDSSSVFLSTAEDQIESSYTKSITQGIASLVLSDNVLTYDGEEYENIYLNAFKTLNYMHLEDWDGALVESRRIALKLENLDIRLNGLSSIFAKKDTSNIADWTPKKANIQSSAFGRYLSTILYAKTGKADDARIEYNRLLSSVKEQETIRRYRGPAPTELPDLTDTDSYNILFSSFTGFAPAKVQNDIRTFFGEDANIYLKFSFPELYLFDTEVANVKVTVNNQDEFYLDMIEEMDAVAAEVYEAKQPIIYGKALARAVLKSAGTNAIRKKAKKESEGLGILAGILGIIGQEVSEKADLRGWQTLPGQAWTQVVRLPEGTHNIRIEYLSEYGTTLYEETQTLEVDKNTELKLIESIYSN